MSTKRVKATKLTVSLPFNLGQIEFQPDEVQQKAAWELYVELSTRIAMQPLGPDEGMLREALSSLHSIFNVTREILKNAGPSVAKGPNSLGAIAIEVLNVGLRPFLAKWHPLLLDYEGQRLAAVSARDHERNWERNSDLRHALANLQEQMIIYSKALALIAGITAG
jgi:hypothetical protein